MKFFKATTLLIALCAILFAAKPARADQPGTNEDPFGGMPIIVYGEEGLARFGLIGGPLPGGVPSRLSGDGTSPRRAINITGIWGESGGDMPPELSNCATLRIPSGNYRWFKLETYSDRRTRIWVDDQLDNATSPSGSAVFGAADEYMLGTNPGDVWSQQAFDNSQTHNFLEGFAMAVYGPESLGPFWAFQPPNAALFSVNVDSTGKLLLGPDGVSVRDATGTGFVGYTSYNPNEPSHLLWYEGRFHGWVIASVYNQMIWDGTVSVCSQRVY